LQIPDKSTKQIAVGSKVKLEEGSETGEVLEIKNNNAIVAFGNLQTKVKAAQSYCCGRKEKYCGAKTKHATLPKF
jgi:hypothetical protein